MGPSKWERQVAGEEPGVRQSGKIDVACFYDGDERLKEWVTFISRKRQRNGFSPGASEFPDT